MTLHDLLALGFSDIDDLRAALADGTLAPDDVTAHVGTDEGEDPESAWLDALAEIEIEIPPWFDGGCLPGLTDDGRIDPHDAEGLVVWLRDLAYGGCASGQYMPAVTYYQAAETMARYGDDVLQYIEDSGVGECLSGEDILSRSWSGIAVFFLSVAVEEWGRATLRALGYDGY